MILNYCKVCKKVISHKKTVCDKCLEKIQGDSLDNYLKRYDSGYPKLSDLYDSPFKEKDFKYYPLFDFRSSYIKRLYQSNDKQLKLLLKEIILQKVSEFGFSDYKIISLTDLIFDENNNKDDALVFTYFLDDKAKETVKDLKEKGFKHIVIISLFISF